MAGTLGFYSYPKVLLRGQSQDLKTAITSMTKREGKRKVKEGRKQRHPRSPERVKQKDKPLLLSGNKVLSNSFLTYCMII